MFDISCGNILLLFDTDLINNLFSYFIFKSELLGLLKSQHQQSLRYPLDPYPARLAFAESNLMIKASVFIPHAKTTAVQNSIEPFCRHKVSNIKYGILCCYTHLFNNKYNICYCYSQNVPKHI